MIRQLLDYNIDYNYTDVWGRIVRDRYTCHTLTEAEDFMLKLKENHGMGVEIYFTTNEKVVFNPY